MSSETRYIIERGIRTDAVTATNKAATNRGTVYNITGNVVGVSVFSATWDAIHRELNHVK
jgi:hypothetical protein